MKLGDHCIFWLNENLAYLGLILKVDLKEHEADGEKFQDRTYTVRVFNPQQGRVVDTNQTGVRIYDPKNHETISQKITPLQ